MRSPQPTSAMEPSDTMELKPTFSRSAQSRTAVTSAPVWLTNATRPRGAMAAANVAFNPVTGLITPRQLGPMSRMPYRRAASTAWRSSSAPSGADLLEARRDDDHGADARLAALLDDAPGCPAAASR